MPIKHTSETVTELARLASIGYTASQAAAQFNGMTRNAAVGIAHRYEFRFMGGAGGGWNRGSTKARRTVARLKSRSPMPERPLTESDSLWITFDELMKDDCRYPRGHTNFRFCGLPAVNGGSWCQHHHGVVYSRGAA